MKYVHEIAKNEYQLDSVACLFDNKYYISDRENNNENPEVRVSLIKYKGKLQIRFAIKGNFHIEEPSYFSKDPDKWIEKIWICFDLEEAEKISDFIKEVKKVKDYVW